MPDLHESSTARRVAGTALLTVAVLQLILSLAAFVWLGVFVVMLVTGRSLGAHGFGLLIALGLFATAGLTGAAGLLFLRVARRLRAMARASGSVP